MKSIKISNILLTLCLSYASLSNAITTEETNFCQQKTTSIYHINGMNTDENTAKFELSLVRDAFEDKVKNLYPNELFEFNLSYN